MSSPSTTELLDNEKRIEEIWRNTMNDVRAIDPSQENWKSQTLPLARIKKIMKSEDIISCDGNVEKPPSRYMIAADSPLLLGKACEFLIRELTTRAWRHTEKSKRRTLQKQDLYAAVGDSDVFDFLIDIVPRIPQLPVEYMTTAAASAMSHLDPSFVDRMRTEVEVEGETLLANSLPDVAREEGLNIMNTNYRLAAIQRVQESYMMMQNRGMPESSATSPVTRTPYRMDVPDSSGMHHMPISQPQLVYTSNVHHHTPPHVIDSHVAHASSSKDNESLSGGSNR